MPVTLARVDERLVHGQIAYSWTNAYPSDVLVVVDDSAAGDEFQGMLLKMAAPAALQCEVLGADAAVAYLKANSAQKAFLVAKTPGAFFKLVEQGIEIPSINIGGLYFVEGRKQISTTVYVDAPLIEDMKKLDARGVKLEIRTSPSDKSVDIMELL